MSLPVVIHDDAAMEIEEAAVWYEARRPGLGLELIAAIDHVVLDISDHPKRFAVWWPPWRRAVLLRFPYVAFFEIQEDRVAVIAIAHARRRPGY